MARRREEKNSEKSEHVKLNWFVCQRRTTLKKESKESETENENDVMI